MISALKIERVLERDEFVLHAQPILRIKTDEVECYEVLLRLPGPKGKLIYPKAFFQQAEQSGYCKDIDRIVAEKAIKALSKTPKTDIALSVNITRDSLSNGGVYSSDIDKLLRENKVDPKRLEIEVDEEVCIYHIDKAKEFIKEAKSIGCRVNIDDFGAGLSSYYYIKSIPSDEAKIDGQFITGFADSYADQAIVRSIVTLFHGIGQEVTAEYVGSRETKRMLGALGVDFAQGNYIGKPIPLEQALDL